jgi:hypothetical protein
MITTNDETLYKKLMVLRTHGITRETASFQNDRELAFGSPQPDDDNWPGWYMEMQTLGYNYRLTDFQAALGISQLARAEQGLARRKTLAERYAQAFAGKPWLKGQSGYLQEHAYHLYVIEVENRAGLYQHLRNHQVFAQIHYIPTHLMPYYQKQGWKPGDMPHAENYYKHCISLPMYPTLTDEQQAWVIQLILDYYRD